MNKRVYQKDESNRREPLRKTAEVCKVLKYSRISLRNFAPSLRFSAVKRLLIQPHDNDR